MRFSGFFTAPTVLLVVMAAAGASTADAQRTGAAQVRFQADAITRRLRAPAAARPDSSARRYIRGDVFRRHVRSLARATTRLASGLPTRERLRLAGAVARTVHAAESLEPRSTDELGGSIEEIDLVIGEGRFDTTLAQHESAVEIEAMTTPRVLEAMTTPDGTVGPVLDDGGQPPPEFLVHLAGDRAVRTVRWDELNVDQRRDLLRSQSVRRSFLNNRRIPGVVFARRIPNPSGMQVTLRGQAQPSGNTVDVDSTLMPHVEYLGADAVRTVGGVEMHVREHGDAGRTLEDAATVADLLETPRFAVHQHVTTRVSPALLRGDRFERVGLVDFYRRVNLVAELDVVLEQRPLQRFASGLLTYFDYLRARQLDYLNGHFAALQQGRQSGQLAHSSLKMAAVGFRTGELYGDPRLFGFEVRTVSTSMAPADRAFVRAVQRGLVARRYGVARGTLLRWLDSRGQSGVDPVETDGRALASLHFNRELSELTEHTPAGLEIPPAALERIRAECDENRGVKLLLHDWASDPTLASDAQLVTRVRDAQNTALRALAAGEPTTAVLQAFVQGSGLRDAYARSIGLSVERAVWSPAL